MQDQPSRRSSENLATHLAEQISRRLLFADAPDFPSAIVDALKKIGKTVGCDRCSLFLFEPGQDRITLKHRWRRSDVSIDDSESFGTDARKDYPWLVSRLLENEPVRLSKLGELPDQATIDRYSLSARKVRSLLMVPLLIGDRPLGSVAVTTLTRHRVWNRQDVDVLESVREPLINALLRYRAEQRALETERLYRALIDQSQAIVFSFDRNGRYDFVSPSVRALTGYRQKEIVGHHFDEFVHPDDVRRLAPAIRRSMARNRPTPPLEYRVRARDGSFHWHRAVMAPVRDASGRLKNIAASALDISDLQREAELRRLLIHLATRFINLPLDQYDAGVESALAHIGNFVGADRVYVFDYEPTTESARNTYEWCVEGVAPEIDRLQSVPISQMEDLFRAHRAGEPVYIDNVAEHPDDRLRELLEELGIRSLLTVPLTREGECHGFVGLDSVRRHRSYSQTDIELLEVFAGILVSLKLRRDAQNRLSNAALRLGQIIDGTRVGTWEWNLVTRQMVFSHRLAEMLGHSCADELPTDSLEWQSRGHPDDLVRARASLAEHLKGRTEHHESEIRVRHRDGHWVWLSIRGQVAARRTNGRAELISGIAIDITERKQADARLKQSEHRFRHLLQDVHGIALQGFDTDCRIHFWNRSSEQLYGWTAGEVVGRCFLDFMVPEEQRQRYRRNIEALIEGRQPHWSSELEFLDRNGRRLSVFASHVVQSNTEGRLELFRIDIDQSEKKAAQDRMRLAENVFDHSHEGIVITDADGKIVEVNEAFARITGYSRDEAIGRNPNFLKSGRQGPDFYRRMWRKLNEEGYWSGEVWNRRKNGEFYAEQLTISTINDHTGKPLRYVGLFFDITRSKEYQQDLERLAHYDPLTELPNRTLLDDRLRRSMTLATQQKKTLLLACIDIDEFKAINDRFGHEFGDECLRLTGTRLREAVRSCDTVARLGGDEFVLVIADLEGGSSAIRFLQRMLETVSRRFRIRDREIRLTFSIGATAYPQGESRDADQLLRQAGQAMYEAKNRGRDQLCLFDADLEAAHVRNLKLIDQMKTALREEQFQLCYQPKVNLATGRILGMEALIRWRHPEKGLLSPAAFLHILETDELAHAVGHWVIARALSDRSAWQDPAGPIDVSVNVSAQQLLRPGFTDALRQQLERHGPGTANTLTLEFLETGLLDDIDQGAEVTRACQRLGVGFALDDFGTGFSSLVHLKHLPLTQIKIDGSFVHGMLSSPDDLSIIEGVINLARVFDVEVLAEGVETPQQAAALMRLGCPNVQGYLVGRPMPNDRIHGWIERWNGVDGLENVTRLSNERIPILFGQAELAANIAHARDVIANPERTSRPLGGHRRFKGWLNQDEHHESAESLHDLREAYRALERDRLRFNDALAARDRPSAIHWAESIEAKSRSIADRLEKLL
jgi:diguanylate cyclase (GGDEF)-like protein/PAS domain S-box-containing protein